MAQFREYQHVTGQNSDGVIGADLGAFATEGALLFIDLGYGDGNYLLAVDDRLKEDMGVRLLDIAVQELNLVFQGQGKAGGN